MYSILPFKGARGRVGLPVLGDQDFPSGRARTKLSNQQQYFQYFQYFRCASPRAQALGTLETLQRAGEGSTPQTDAASAPVCRTLLRTLGLCRPISLPQIAPVWLRVRLFITCRILWKQTEVGFRVREGPAPMKVGAQDWAEPELWLHSSPG